MDTVLSGEFPLFPVTCLIVTGFHRTELDARVTLEVVDIVVDEVDDILTELNRVEIHLVGSAALHNGNHHLRLGRDDAGLHDELGLVVRAGDQECKISVR